MRANMNIAVLRSSSFIKAGKADGRIDLSHPYRLNSRDPDQCGSGAFRTHRGLTGLAAIQISNLADALRGQRQSELKALSIAQEEHVAVAGRGTDGDTARRNAPPESAH